MEAIVFEKDRFQELREELLERRAKTDIVVAANKLHMTGEGNLTVPIPKSDGDAVSGKPTRWAESQIAEYIGMPTAYYRKMATYPDLFAYNANYWLEKSGDLRLVRIFRNEVIAFLSNAYRAIDSYDVATAVMESANRTLAGQNLTMQVSRASITEKVFDLWVMTLEHPIEYPDGEKYQLGMHVRNSDVGAASFVVEAMIVRRSCSNGMIFGDSIDQRHIGKRLQEGDIWSQRTTELNAALTVSQVDDMTKYSFDVTNAKRFADSLQGLKNEPIEVSAKYIDATERILKLSEEDKDSIWKKVRENNKYELVQAVTAYANDLFKGTKPDPEKATKMQKIGGELVQSRSIWDQIKKESEKN